MHEEPNRISMEDLYMSIKNNSVSDVTVNIQEKATVIWNIANALVGYFKPHEYGTVILPIY